MKKLSGIIITFCILTTLLGCKKKDIIVEDYTPTLTSIDISDAKFLLSGNRLSDTISLTKISSEGIETPIILLDEDNEPVEWKYVDYVDFLFTSDKYVGMVIRWRINASIYQSEDYKQRIFYLINKYDSKIVFTYNFGESTSLDYPSYFSMDQNDIIYYLSDLSLSGYSLYRFKWNESNTSDSKPELIEKDIQKYYLTPNGDLACMKETRSGGFVNYYYTIKFSDRSQLVVPSWGNNSYDPYEGYGIYTLGVNNSGGFCACYKNPNSTFEMKILQTINNKTDFWYCNSVTETINKFYIVRGQLWGIHNTNNTYSDFINLSNCGSYSISSTYLPIRDLSYYSQIRTSQDYFYYYNTDKNEVYRFYPEDGATIVWKTFPIEMDIFGSEYEFSIDDFAIFTLYSRNNIWLLVLLDNNGNELAQKVGTLIRSAIVL